MRLVFRVAFAGVLFLVPFVKVRGQEKAPAPWGLFNVRFDTRTSDFIYAVYGYGATFGVVGALHNPRSDWSELVGGVGRNFSFGNGPGHTLAIAAARASESWYGQVYYLPAVAWRSLRVRASAELDVPLNRSGSTQFAFSPVSATVVVSKLVEAGASMDLYASRGESTTVLAGPQLRLALPSAVLGGDVQQQVGSRATRLRVFFSTSF
jgi:hypothetical protein